MIRVKQIALWIYVGFIIFPFVFLLVLSLATDWRYPQVLPSAIGLTNWDTMIGGQSDLIGSFALSMILSLLVAMSSTFLGLWVSRYVAYHNYRKELTLLMYFPYVIAPVVLGSCLTYFFIKMDLYGHFGGVLLAQMLVAFPYAVIFFTSFWGEQTKGYEELVATLGGSTLQGFQQVILPLAWPMISICFFQTFLISWFEYGLTSIIGVGKVETLTVKVFLYIKESNFYYGALACVLLMLPPVMMVYFNRSIVLQKPLTYE